MSEKFMIPEGQPRRLPADPLKIHVLQQARPSKFADLVNSICAGRSQYFRTTPDRRFDIIDGIVT